jgi:transketolase
MQEVVNALTKAYTLKGMPIAIISNTIKGKGISFMEDNPKWHSRALTDEEYEIAMQDLNKAKEEIQ